MKSTNTILSGFTAWAHAQSFVAGDLAKKAPYGLDPAAFASWTAHPVAARTVATFGYNVSSPTGDTTSGNASSVDGWRLGLAVAQNVPFDVPLDHSTDVFDVFDATTLSLVAPPGVPGINTTVWRLCATVFPGTLGPVSDECAESLSIAAMAIGVDEHGHCRAFPVPPDCVASLAPGSRGVVANIVPETLADGRFYAWGSAPTTRNNATSLETALTHVWPVVVTWMHLGPNGDPYATNAYAVVISASEKVETSHSPSF